MAQLSNFSSSLYESAGNKAHRKPGGGQGQASRKRRAIDMTDPKRQAQQADYDYSQRMSAGAADYEHNAAVARDADEGKENAERAKRMREQAKLPAVYRKPARKH